MYTADEAREQARLNKIALGEKKVIDEWNDVVNEISTAISSGEDFTPYNKGICKENVAKLRDAGYRFYSSKAYGLIIRWGGEKHEDR